MKQQIENIIKKNLPEKKEIYPINVEKQDEKWNYLNGFNQALSQINTSLIADEVLKVVKQSLKDGLLKRMMKYDSKDGYSVLHDEIIEKVYEDVEDLLSTLSPNKENEIEEIPLFKGTMDKLNKLSVIKENKNNSRNY